MIGHSQGEIAAAYIAGVLSLDEAAKIVALRSQALSASVVPVPWRRCCWLPKSCSRGCSVTAQALSIAAINGPSHTVVSGHPAALEQFIEACSRDGIHIRSIAVDYASHSAQVEPLREQLLEELADLTPGPARIPLYSTVESAVSGDPLDTTTMDAEYWYANLREPVGFYDSVVGLLAAVSTRLWSCPRIRCWPRRSPTPWRVAGRARSVVITTLHRDRPDLDALSAALGRLHIHGHSPSWPALYPRAHLWRCPPIRSSTAAIGWPPARRSMSALPGWAGPEHPLLGAVTELADQDQIVLSGRLSMGTQGWLAGHVVSGVWCFPRPGSSRWCCGPAS